MNRRAVNKNREKIKFRQAIDLCSHKHKEIMERNYPNPEGVTEMEGGAF